MSGLPTYAYEPFGAECARTHHFSQAIRVGDMIHCAGQGGYDLVNGGCFKEINKQIDTAFEMVDRNLRDAGGKGWEQVYRINSYHVPLNQEAQDAMVRNFRKWLPNHKPVWTCVQVGRLGQDDMRVEIEVSAYDPQPKA